MTAPSTAAIERTLRIEARPEIVFGLLTDAEQMVRWQGIAAEIDAVGGSINAATASGSGVSLIFPVVIRETSRRSSTRRVSCVT